MVCKSGMKYLVLVLVCLSVVATVALAFNIPGVGKYDTVKAANGMITIPVAKVNDGKAHFFKFADGGKEVKFFVVKGSDGHLHTAFDACDVCYHEKKGYEQQGDQMLCKNCNKKFAINRIGQESRGGCNPSSLPARIDATNIRIMVDDLRAGATFF
ncbi:DUF2318 domain-containing protein [Geomonas sp.]|uniref:DUF2318 domain-containing protein n=1 Tax=Geomonas sp. TaxID=2651584 RepID=UPI002B4692B4|nr:DUF2318 domain-containing protein [Geomonas sp.]HJV37123.1 DUF2318 domain-containing protein [Geomonas sp.]